MAAGRIALLSPLAVVNALVRHVCRVGPFTMRRYVAIGRHALNRVLPVSDRDPHLEYMVPWTQLSQPLPQTAFRSVHGRFCTAHAYHQHIQTTQRAKSVATANRPHLCRQCGIITYTIGRSSNEMSIKWLAVVVG